MPYWRTCIFQDIRTKKQAYLNLLAEEMAKNDFQQSGKKKINTWEAVLLKGTDLMFETPDGKFDVSIHASPSNGDLLVGFMLLAKTKQNILFFIFSFLGLTISLVPAYIIRNALPSIDGFSLAMLWLIIGLSIGVGLPLLLLYGPSVKTWNQQLMQILVKSAESVGSKQKTPFKRLWISKMK